MLGCLFDPYPQMHRKRDMRRQSCWNFLRHLLWAPRRWHFCASWAAKKASIDAFWRPLSEYHKTTANISKVRGDQAGKPPKTQTWSTLRCRMATVIPDFSFGPREKVNLEKCSNKSPSHCYPLPPIWTGEKRWWKSRKNFGTPCRASAKVSGAFSENRAMTIW